MKVLILLILSFTIFANDKKEIEQKAMEKIQQLASNLQKELKTAMEKSPVDAVEKCHHIAPITQKETSEDKIKVGRVSRKNRNPNNQVRPWMEATIKKYESGTISSPYEVVTITKQQKGILKPIKMQGLCLNCHGTNISKPVLDKILKLYPADQATGYKVGEIRGYFWAVFEQ